MGLFYSLDTLGLPVTPAEGELLQARPPFEII
jgi:hypothetical protein